MKAAVMFPGESMPRYMDVPEPVAGGGGELLVSVKAVAVKHLDRSRAAGRHYSSEASSGEGRVAGGEQAGDEPYGVGVSWHGRWSFLDGGGRGGDRAGKRRRPPLRAAFAKIC